MTNKNLFDAARDASKSAPLQTTGEVKATGATRRKNLNLPVEFFDRFDAMKANGKTTLDFSAFIMEAIREKFDAQE